MSSRVIFSKTNIFPTICKQYLGQSNISWCRYSHILNKYKDPINLTNGSKTSIPVTALNNQFHTLNSRANLDCLNRHYQVLQQQLKIQVICKRNASFDNVDKDLLMKYLASLQEEYNGILQAYQEGGRGQELYNRKMFLSPIIDVYQQMLDKHKEMDELKQLAAEDDDMKSMTEDEIGNISEQLDNLTKQVLDNLVPDLKYDRNDVIMELNPGVGGDEAKLFTLDMCNMYENYANYKGWTFEMESSQTSDAGGVSGVRILISGYDVFKTLKYESGIHRVQRVPKTERTGRIHTSTSAVAILPKPDEIDITLNNNDLEITAVRSSGPGGQSVNKLNTNVRILHIPTGMAVTCQETRSQIKNKQIALEKLRANLYAKEFEEQMSKIISQRKLQVGSRGRSEKIRTYNFPQNRVTDHRIHYSANLDGIMNGTEVLDELIQHLQEESRKEILIEMLEEFKANST